MRAKYGIPVRPSRELRVAWAYLRILIASRPLQRLWQKIDQSWPLTLLRLSKGAGRVLALVFAFLLGTLWTQITSYDHTRYRYNVRVIEKLNPQDYWMQSEDGDRWLAKFCTDTMLDLDPGMTLEYLIYQERGRCKSITDSAPNTGFKVKRDQITRKFVDFRIGGSNHVR